MGTFTALGYSSFNGMLEDSGWRVAAQRASESVGTIPFEAIKLLAPILF